MSRHMLARESPLEARSFEAHEQKCSGLLVATGSGSGGWFRSASRYLDPRGDEHLSRLDVTDRWESASFAPQLRKAHFVAAEPSSAIVKQRTGPGAFEHVSGTLLEGEALTARSRNDSHGIIALDAQRQYEFPLGHELRVELTQQPLWHLRLEAGKV
jgi:hypothetical protein